MKRPAAFLCLLLLAVIGCPATPPPREVIAWRRGVLGLPVEPTGVHDGMEILARNEDLGLLDRISGENPESVDDRRVLDTALRSASVLRAIRWEEFEQGPREEVERLVETAASAADRLAEAAAARERARYAALADEVASSCVECHLQYRPDEEH